MRPFNDLSPMGRTTAPTQAPGAADPAQWASIDRQYQLASYEAHAAAFKQWGLTALPLNAFEPSSYEPPDPAKQPD